MTTDRKRAATTMATWAALLVASMTWLVGWEPASVDERAPGLDPALATMTVVRGAALVLGGYLLGVSVLALAVRLLRLPRVVIETVESLAPSAVRHLVRLAAGVTMTTMASSTPALASTAGSAPVVVAAQAIEQPAGLAPVDEPVVMRRLPDVDEGLSSEAVSSEAVSSEAGPSATAPPRGETTRVIRPGDHFWSIAEAELRGALGRSVTDAEIDPFWRALVAANRHVTPDPDFLVPGQVVRVPAVP